MVLSKLCFAVTSHYKKRFFSIETATLGDISLMFCFHLVISIKESVLNFFFSFVSTKNSQCKWFD